MFIDIFEQIRLSLLNLSKNPTAVEAYQQRVAIGIRRTRDTTVTFCRQSRLSYLATAHHHQQQQQSRRWDGVFFS